MADTESDDSVTSSSESCNDGSPKRRHRALKKPRNIFKNDGSFLKMFQLLQQEGKSETNSSMAQASPSNETSPAVQTTSTETLPISSCPSRSSSPPSQCSSRASPNPIPSNKDSSRKKSLMSFVGKRRGGKVLPTGVVKKQRRDDPVKEQGNPKDAWSQYMEEVRKYKELSCEEEGKTRPLVK